MNNNYGNYPQYNVNYAASPQQQDSGRKALRIGGVIFAVILIGMAAIFFLVSTVISRIFDEINEQCTEKTTAVVSDNVKKTNDDGGTTFAPVYTFTANGQIYNVQSTFYSSPALYEIGDTAEIQYDPSDPKQVYDPTAVKTFETIMNVFSYIGIGAAAFGVLVMILALVLTRKRDPAVRDELDYYN